MLMVVFKSLFFHFTYSGRSACSLPEQRLVIKLSIMDIDLFILRNCSYSSRGKNILILNTHAKNNKLWSRMYPIPSCKIWNSLPDSMRTTRSLKEFKMNMPSRWRGNVVVIKMLLNVVIAK